MILAFLNLNNIMSKAQLREEAKALLLKGCYRMAFKKYNLLIQMGSDGFTQREWAVIHLNQGICQQFLEQFDKAIDSINRSLQIDPTYQKSYYRKLQILREIGRLEEAIYSVPIWIKNKQIEGLLKQIKEQHLSSMGMNQILEDLLSKKNLTIQFRKEAHTKFFQRIIESIDSECSDKHLIKVGDKMACYYKYLKQENMSEVLEPYLSKIHYLLVKQRQNKKVEQSYKILLEAFWKQYNELAAPMTQDRIVESQIKVKEEYKILKYAPLNSQGLRFLQLLMMDSSIRNQGIFQMALQISSNLSQNLKQFQAHQQVYTIISKFIQKLNNQLNHHQLPWIKRFFMLIDSLIKFHLFVNPELCFDSLDQVNIFYLRYYFVNSSSQNVQLESTAFKKLKNQYIIAYFSQNMQNFLSAYLFQHFIHRLDRTALKELIPVIEEQLDMIKQIKSIVKRQNKKRQQLQLQYQFLLIYSSLLLKIDLKNQANKVNVASIMNSHQKSNGSLSDMQINTLLLLAISRKENVIQILQDMDCVTDVIAQFLSSPFPEQIQNVKIVTSFVYLMVVNLEDEQQETFARKMGTSVEEIRKARKIQGQKGDEKITQQLLVSQTKCKQYISKNWIEIIPNYCDILSKIKDESSLKKWTKFLNQIGRIDHSRFFNPKIINILLECFKLQKAAVGQLLSIMCKKVNVALIKYQYLQSITNILVDNIEHSPDELVIFQSLLGLINITSNSTTKVRIPIKTISDAVFEQNKYIVHAACSLLNNLLAINDEETGKQVNLKDIVQQYVKFYREQIDNDEGIPLSDYSHPSTVYSTLLSLAMVLDLDHIPQFQDWTALEPCLLKIRTSRSEILYKSVWYLSMKGRVKTKWWTKFEKDLNELQKIDQQRWLKLQQYIKK